MVGGGETKPKEQKLNKLKKKTAYKQAYDKHDLLHNNSTVILIITTDIWNVFQTLQANRIITYIQ